MKKILFGFAILLVLVLAGCLSDPVQKELLNYINNEAKEAYELETEAVDAYSSVTGANYTNDLAMYNGLVDVVIPAYTEFIDELKGIDVEAKEIQDLHDKYIEGAELQLEAFETFVVALENQDAGQIEEGNELLDEGRSIIDEYVAGIENLAEEHNVELEDY